jgi:hypothetical protein
MSSLSGIFWVTSVLGAFGALIWLYSGCRHPSPHYVRAETRKDDVTGEEMTVRPAQYVCYECGKMWLAQQRDPAWTPSVTVRKFSGYDERKAVRGAKRMAQEERQRRTLAGRRVRPVGPAAAPIQFKPEVTPARRPTEVVNLSTRKPA